MSYYLLEKELRDYFKVLIFVTSFSIVFSIIMAVLFVTTYYFIFLILFILSLIAMVFGSISTPLCYKAYYKKATIIENTMKVFLKNKCLFSIDLNTIQKSMVNVDFVQGKYDVLKKCIVLHNKNVVIKNNMKFYWNKKHLLYIQEPNLISLLTKNNNDIYS